MKQRRSRSTPSRAARHSAVLTGHVLELTYRRQGAAVQTGARARPRNRRSEARLLAPVKGNEMLIGGQAVEAPLARVRFYPTARATRSGCNHPGTTSATSS